NHTLRKYLEFNFVNISEQPRNKSHSIVIMVTTTDGENYQSYGLKLIRKYNLLITENRLYLRNYFHF
ncbi:hypothetical protein RB23_09235, partial [Francisella tularensis subsp. holarctica]